MVVPHKSSINLFVDLTIHSLDFFPDVIYHFDSAGQLLIIFSKRMSIAIDSNHTHRKVLLVVIRIL
jgi:hypothetical protein